MYFSISFYCTFLLSSTISLKGYKNKVFVGLGSCDDVQTSNMRTHQVFKYRELAHPAVLSSRPIWPIRLAYSSSWFVLLVLCLLLQSCNFAMLQSWKVAMFQSCKIKLQFSNLAKSSCNFAMLKNGVAISNVPMLQNILESKTWVYMDGRMNKRTKGQVDFLSCCCS